MANQAASDFFALLEKSGLVDAATLDEARQAAGKSDDAQSVARALVRKGKLSRWQAGQLLADRTAFSLGKYKLIDLLGRGGMGSVFLAEHSTMNRLVALKIVAKHIAGNPQLLDRFLTEARAIAALDHPNIVRAYSVDNEGDRYYLVMEYVDGPDLSRLVEQEGPLEVRRAADYVAQAAAGLAHAHGQKIIHCDIKPSNLLVNGQGVVKILDMGLARLTGRDRPGQQAEDDAVLGSVDYLAPEQAVEGPEFDHRADIYALGCTLYYLLVGHPPFPEGTLPERIMKHQTQEPPGIRQLRPEVPQGLVAICDRMMAKRPADRYQSADEVSRALAAWAKAPGDSKPVVPLDQDALDDEEEAENGLPVIDVGAVSRRGGRLARVAAKPAEQPQVRSSEGKPPVARNKTGAANGAAPVKAQEKPQADESSVAVAAGAAAAAGRQKRGLLATRQRKTVAASVGILAVGGLAAAIILLVVGPMLGTSQPQPGGEASAAAHTGGAAAVPERIEEMDVPIHGAAKAATATAPGASQKSSSPAAETGSRPAAAEHAPAEAGPGESPEPAPGESATGATPAEPAAEPATPQTPHQESSQPPGAEPGPARPDGPQQEAGSEKPESKGPAPKDPGPKTPKPGPAPQDQPSVEPLRDLAAAIELPPLPAAGSTPPPDQVVSLGPVHLKQGEPLDVRLLGGEDALPGKQQFEMAADARANGTSWIIGYRPPAAVAAADAPSQVARVFLANDTLNMQWLAGAAEGQGNFLRNCGLNISAGGQSHWTGLSAAKQVTPLALDLDRGTSRAMLPLEWSPKAESLRLEISGVEGFPEHQTKPADTIAPKDRSDPNSGAAVLSYTADGGTEIAVQVTFDVAGRNARVETSTYYQIAGQPPQLFRVGEVAGLYNMALVAQQKYDALAKKLKDEKKKAAEKQRDAAKAAAEQLLGLNGVYQALNKTAKIQFRVYSLVGDQQLVLFEPKPPEAQPAQAIEGASAEQLNLGGDRKEEGDSGEPRRFFSK